MQPTQTALVPVEPSAGGWSPRRVGGSRWPRPAHLPSVHPVTDGKSRARITPTAQMPCAENRIVQQAAGIPEPTRWSPCGHDPASFPEEGGAHSSLPERSAQPPTQKPFASLFEKIGRKEAVRSVRPTVGSAIRHRRPSAEPWVLPRRRSRFESVFPVSVKIVVSQIFLGN